MLLAYDLIKYLKILANEDINMINIAKEVRKCSKMLCPQIVKANHFRLVNYLS